MPMHGAHRYFCACLKTSWNYGDKYAKYQSETISLKNSQICLLSQQNYNKIVLFWQGSFTNYTANIYDQITMELQPFIVVVRRFTGDINYSAKFGSFLYETVKLRINQQGRIRFSKQQRFQPLVVGCQSIFIVDIGIKEKCRIQC